MKKKKKVAVNVLNNERQAAGKVWYSGLSKIIFEKILLT
jgi:hypothetical protein